MSVSTLCYFLAFLLFLLAAFGLQPLPRMDQCAWMLLALGLLCSSLPLPLWPR